MKHFFAALVLLVAMSVAACADDGPEGTISVYNASQGTIQARFAGNATIEARDIFTILQRGTVIGEAMVIKSDKGVITLLPKKVKGTPKSGDQLKFSRHAEVPLDGTEGWKPYKAGEFSVVLPSQPVGPKTENTTSGEGNPVVRQEWAAVDQQDQTVYIIMVERFVSLHKLGANERWADAESSMDYSLKNMASAKGGKLDYARRVELGKIPGREFEVSYPDGLKMRGRIFAANLTFYLFSAVTKDKAPSVRSLKFLNSVQLNVKI